MNIFDTYTVTISVTGLEIACLQKLSLVSHALAGKLGGSAEREQAALAGTLDEVIRKVSLAVGKGGAA